MCKPEVPGIFQLLSYGVKVLHCLVVFVFEKDLMSNLSSGYILVLYVAKTFNIVRQLHALFAQLYTVVAKVKQSLTG